MKQLAFCRIQPSCWIKVGRVTGCLAITGSDFVWLGVQLPVLAMLKAAGCEVLLSPELLPLCPLPSCPSAPSSVQEGCYVCSCSSVNVSCLNTGLTHQKWKVVFFDQNLNQTNKKHDRKVKFFMGENPKATFHPHKQNKTKPHLPINTSDWPKCRMFCYRSRYIFYPWQK